MNIFKHYGYVIVMCCCLIMSVCIGLVFSCAGIFYGPVSTELNITVGRFGIYMSLLYMSSALVLSFSGRLIEKYSARLLLSLSSTVLGLCLIAMSFFTSVYQFYIAGVLIGITMSFLLYLSFPTLINRWFKTRLGFFIGLCSAFSGIGGVLFNPMGAYLITRYGWRETYLIFGLVILSIVSPILWIFLRDYPRDKGLLPYGEEGLKKTDRQEIGIEYEKAIRRFPFYGMIIFAFLMISVSTLNLFLPSYVTGLGFTLSEGSLIASFVMLGVTIGKIFLGMINDKSVVLGVFSSIGLGIIGLLLLMFGISSMKIMLMGAFLFGFAYAGVTVETALLVRELFGNKDYTRIYSSIAVSLAIGGTIAAGGWGLLLDFMSFRIILLIGMLFLFISGLIGICSLQKANINRKGANIS